MIAEQSLLLINTVLEGVLEGVPDLWPGQLAFAEYGNFHIPFVRRMLSGMPDAGPVLLAGDRQRKCLKAILCELCKIGAASFFSQTIHLE